MQKRAIKTEANRSKLSNKTALSAAENKQREVAGVAGADMRADFLLSHPDGSRTLLEVKVGGV